MNLSKLFLTSILTLTLSIPVIAGSTVDQKVAELEAAASSDSLSSDGLPSIDINGESFVGKVVNLRIDASQRFDVLRIRNGNTVIAVKFHHHYYLNNEAGFKSYLDSRNIQKGSVVALQLDCLFKSPEATGIRYIQTLSNGRSVRVIHLNGNDQHLCSFVSLENYNSN